MTGGGYEEKGYILSLTIDVPVVYVARDEMSLMWDQDRKQILFWIPDLDLQVRKSTGSHIGAATLKNPRSETLPLSWKIGDYCCKF